LGRILWWEALWMLCRVWFGLCYRYRAWGVERIPSAGPVLFVVNHQSYFDPILVGLGAHRRHSYNLARSSLWRFKPLGWLISSLNGLPVERGAADLAAMRRCIELLKGGQALVVFPEGTRTPDGTTHAFAAGLMLLIRRAQPRVVPVALQGAFEVWPRSRRWPRLLGRTAAMYGRPVEARELLGVDAQMALERLRQEVETMRLELAERLRGQGRA
jgi:1-acyl-sn-glycerol-3-phosphate acyltransferase